MSRLLIATARRPPRNFWVGSSTQKSLPALVDEAAHLSIAVASNRVTRVPAYEEAREAAERGAAHPRELAFSAWSLPRLVEAAIRSNQPALADDAMQRLAQITGPSGTDWALGVEARSRALVSDDGGAERFYREALDRLRRCQMRLDLARAHLLYGEWLRRERRRVDARAQLRAALDQFASMRIDGFAERARKELLATVRESPQAGR
jgi:hypothetical protein